MPKATAAVPETIDRRTALSYRDFLHEYLIPRRPVIVGDALAGHPRLLRWTPERFQERYGDKEVEVGGVAYRLGELIDGIKASTDEKPAPYYSTLDGNLEFPELVPDTLPRVAYSLPDWLTSPLLKRDWLQPRGRFVLKIGGRGAGHGNIHVDGYMSHAFILQIHGPKRFFLYSPDQAPRLYPDENAPERSTLNEGDQPDPREYPLFYERRPAEALLEGGEMIFVPCGWWHATVMPDPSVTIAYNIVNRSNWRLFVRDMSRLARKAHPLRRALLRTQLELVGIVHSVLDDRTR